MRQPIAMVLTIAALALTQAASAAPSSGSAPVLAPAPTVKPASSSKPVQPESPKHAACEQTWKAQTKHTGKHKAFIAACVAKG